MFQPLEQCVTYIGTLHHILTHAHYCIKQLNACADSRNIKRADRYDGQVARVNVATSEECRRLASKQRECTGSSIQHPVSKLLVEARKDIVCVIVLGIACEPPANDVRVHRIKEWQTIQAEDGTLQPRKHHQSLLVTCLNVTMKLLQHVERIRLKQRDGCPSRTLEDDRPLTGNIVALHSVNKGADVRVLLLDGHLACINKRLTKLAHYICRHEARQFLTKRVACELCCPLHSSIHLLHPCLRRHRGPEAQIVKYLMVELTHILDRTNLLVTRDQFTFPRTKIIADAIGHQLRSGWYASAIPARHRNTREFPQLASKLTVISNEPLDTLQLSAKHDRSRNHVDHRVGNIKPQHHVGQCKVSLLQALTNNVTRHGLIHRKVEFLIGVRLAKTIACRNFVGFLPRNNPITSITECLVNSLSCFETHLVHELIETIKHRKLLLLGDVECSLDEVIKGVSDLALEARANTANNRLGNFPILIAQEAEL